MKLEDAVARLRREAVQTGQPPVATTLQGVTRQRVRSVLTRIDRGSDDQIDAVFALLDPRPSWFSRIRTRRRFSEGASTAHLACHVGILQRGKTKLDREGRDYWIKPLRDVGAIEPVTLVDGDFLPGHIIAKSPVSAYRLNEDFKAILQAPEDRWPEKLQKWISADAVRTRLELQAQAAEKSRAMVGSSHADLIRSAIEYYVPRFLVGFEVVYVDDGDGDRVTAEQKETLAKAGITLELDDAMPDVLLWNRSNGELWVIEAVSSDGEVDLHKVQKLKALAQRSGRTGIHFTTAYDSWKDAAARQGMYKNIAPETYIWIREDPSRHLLVESY